MSAGTVTVWEVLYLCDGPGRFGDGIATERFRSKSAAKAFCVGKRYYGAPAEPLRSEVPRRIATRWGLA